jgi:hypothetical protein
MADFRYRTDLNPDHYAFRRQLPGWYPDERRDTHEDRLADRVVLIVSAIVVVLLITGVLA